MGAMLADFVKAWNQGKNPDLYELENAAWTAKTLFGTR